jgi:hypothetical protein
VPVLSPLGGLRAPENGLPRFLLQRAVLLGDRPALVDGAAGGTLSYAGLDALVRPSGTVLRSLLRRRTAASAPLPSGAPDGRDVLPHEMPR